VGTGKTAVFHSICDRTSIRNPALIENDRPEKIRLPVDTRAFHNRANARIAVPR
jgi:hypothetical protein